VSGDSSVRVVTQPIRMAQRELPDKSLPKGTIDSSH
jgi:hypothetical protein